MASTIQLKRGTGSAVPTGLSDGELAINLDNNKLYFGTGSAVKNDFHFNTISSSGDISGSLAGTISAGSGSYHVLQGDTSKDTSLYVGGAITSSGQISASGNIYGDTAYFSNSAGVYADKIRRFSDSSTTTKIVLNDEVIKIHAGHSSNESVNVQLDEVTITPALTASNISSSGTIVAKKIKALGSEVVLENGHITASGNISGSVSSNITIGGTLTAGVITGTLEGSNLGNIYDSRIYLTPNDFFPNSLHDYSRTAGGAIAGNGAYLADGGGRLTYTAMKVIPKGYKATHTVVFGSYPAGDTFTTLSSSIGSIGSGITAGEAGSATAVNTVKDITDIVGGTDGMYCIIQWEANALRHCYGGYITIAKS